MCLEAHWKVFYCCYDSLAQWLLTSQHNWLQLNSRSSQTVPGITLFTIWTRSLKFVNKNQVQNYFSHLWIFVDVCSPACKKHDCQKDFSQKMFPQIQEAEFGLLKCLGSLLSFREAAAKSGSWWRKTSEEFHSWKFSRKGKLSSKRSSPKIENTTVLPKTSILNRKVQVSWLSTA